MHIWRLEQAHTGLGPYRLRNKDGETLVSGTAMWHRPMPTDDLILRSLLGNRSWEGDMSSAYLSPEDAACWFHTGRERRALADNDFRLRCYDVPDEHVLVGATQALVPNEHLTKEALVSEALVARFWWGLPEYDDSHDHLMGREETDEAIRTLRTAIKTAIAEQPARLPVKRSSARRAL